MSQWMMRGILVVLAFVVDQVTGAWARTALSHGRGLSFLHGVVHFQLLYNRGAMLGLGSGHAGWVTVLSVIGTVVIGVLAFRLQRGGLPWALMTGGAIGNVMSRVVSGRVTDFIHVAGYPGIFNLSDVALRIGVIWFLVVVVRGSQRRTVVKPGPS